MKMHYKFFIVGTNQPDKLYFGISSCYRVMSTQLLSLFISNG